MTQSVFNSVTNEIRHSGMFLAGVLRRDCYPKQDTGQDHAGMTQSVFNSVTNETRHSGMFLAGVLRRDYYPK